MRVLKTHSKRSALGRLMVCGALFFFGPSSLAAAPDKDKVTEIKIRASVFALSAFSNYGLLIDHLPKAADRTFIRKGMSTQLKAPVKAQYLAHNTLLITLEGENIPVQVIDLDTHHFSILKHDYYFDPNESAESAVHRLQHFVAANEKWDLLEPRAQALNYWRLGRWAFGLWSSVAMGLGYECAKQGWNSNGKCAEFGAEWPLAAGLFGVGLTVMGYEEAKGYLSDKTFELTDIACSEKGQPIKATILDSKQQKMTLNLYQSPIGLPDRIEFQLGEGQSEALYFHNDWSPAPERAPTKAPTFEARAADVIAEGAHNISKLCAGADSKTALERYKKMKDGTQTVAPNPNSPTATVK